MATTRSTPMPPLRPAQSSAATLRERLAVFRRPHPGSEVDGDGRRWRYLVSGRGARPLLVPADGIQVGDLSLLLFAALEPDVYLVAPASRPGAAVHPGQHRRAQRQPAASPRPPHAALRAPAGGAGALGDGLELAALARRPTGPAGLLVRPARRDSDDPAGTGGSGRRPGGVAGLRPTALHRGRSRRLARPDPHHRVGARRGVPPGGAGGAARSTSRPRCAPSPAAGTRSC